MSENSDYGQSKSVNPANHFCVVALKGGVRMSSCLGDHAISTKVDDQMESFLTSEAERLGVSRAELLRRILDSYRESRYKNIECHNCGAEVMFPVESDP
jgi:hypothetical protein